MAGVGTCSTNYRSRRPVRLSPKRGEPNSQPRDLPVLLVRSMRPTLLLIGSARRAAHAPKNDRVVALSLPLLLPLHSSTGVGELIRVEFREECNKVGGCVPNLLAGALEITHMQSCGRACRVWWISEQTGALVYTARQYHAHKTQPQRVRLRKKRTRHKRASKRRLSIKKNRDRQAKQIKKLIP